jgi:restriction endonuclease S subunit
VTLNLDRSTWKRVAFGDVIENVADRVDNPSMAGVDRYVGLEHLDPGLMTIKRWGTPDQVNAQKLLFQPGDVIFGRRRAYQKKVAQANFRGICSAHALVMRARPDFIYPNFLPVFLSSDYFLDRAISISVGSLSPTVNWRDLRIQEFDLPPLDEQQRVANLLWAIEQHRSSLQVSAARAYATSENYFSDALSAHEAPMRPATDLIRDMTVGVVVKPAQYYTEDTENGIPALRGLNVLQGRFDLTDMVYFRQESAAELTKSTLRVGDVVVVRTGRPGDAAVVTDQIAGFNCIDLIITRPGANLIPEFLATYLNSSYGRAQVERLSAGTAQQHFNVGALKKLRLPALGKDAQSRLISHLEQIRELVNALESERSCLDRVARSIMAEIFRSKA